MAGSKIKGITIEIGGDTTGLDKALRGVNSEIKETQSNLKDVEKALKLDPKNTELLAQKQRELAKAVDATSKKLDTLKEAQKQAAEQLARGDIGQEQYDALTREIVKTEAELKNAKQAAAGFNAELEASRAKLTEVSTAAGTVADKTKGLSTAAAGALTALGGLAVKAADTADELMSMSKQSGISTTELQRMKYAADLVDVSLDSMVGAQAKLTKSMAGNTEAFDRLGVQVRMSNGTMRDANTVFYETLTALSRVGNETERDQLAMQIFGKSANELAGIIDDGGAALRAYGDEAEQLGLVMDETTLQGLNAFNDELDRLKAAAMADLLKAGATALEGLRPLLETIIDVLGGLLNIIGNLSPGLISVLGTMALMVATISPVAGIINAITAAAASAGGVIAALEGVLATTGGRIKIVVVLLSMLVGLIISIASAWSDMSGWEKAISVMGALVVAATAAAIALGAVQSAASMGIAAAAIVAGIVAITAAVNSATKRANASAATPMTSQGSAAMTRGSYGVPQGGTTNNYNTNTYYQTSSQPMNVNLNLDGQTLARQMVTPMNQAYAAAGGSNMN